MSPIEYIEEGIREGNWRTVCDGYEKLTGKSLSVPVIHNETKALNGIRDIILATFSDQKSMKKKSGRSKGSKGKTTVTKEGEDSSLKLNCNDKTVVQKNTDGVRLITNDPDPEEIEDNRLKAARANKNKLQLQRSARGTYEVECSECEQSFQSSRPVGEMGQKCITCLKDKKGRFI